MKLGIYLALFGCFFCLAAQSQVVISGRVTDVETGTELYGAEIELQQSGKKTSTNWDGNFAIKTVEGDDSLNYQFSQNTLVWQGNLSINLTVYSANGQLIMHQQDLGEEGLFVMPNFRQGIYIMHLETPYQTQQLKLYSNGYQAVVVDKDALQLKPSPSTERDTLVVTKKGYITRKIGITQETHHHNLKMLRGDIANLKYLNELIDEVAFEVLSSDPPRTHFGKVKSVKFIYSSKDDQVYYMNTKMYQLHYDFAEDAMGFDQGRHSFNTVQYRDHPKRYLYTGSLNYYESQNRYVLQFIAANEIKCDFIETVFNRMKETSFIGDDLEFYSIKPGWDNCDVKHVDAEVLFKGQNYQALNLTENYGYLRKIDIENLENEYIGRRDLVLTNGIPNDLPVVAGIITTEFQTPLSHINVLSNSRGTPNMALRDGWDNKKIEKLIDQLVYIKVDADDFVLRPASMEEAEKFWEKREPQNPIFLKKDIEFKELISMEDADQSYLHRIGGKASNFAEILNSATEEQAISVPEMGFAIPFYYYDQHVKSHGIQTLLDSFLESREFKTNPTVRRAALADIRTRIEHNPLDPELIRLVEAKINYFRDFDAFRFRSSTNAEDLEDFSGAGLYTSKSAKKGHSTKTVENAIKKVWASLWNWRAFEERDYFKIDHKTCAMGILAHRSFPDEDANGVLITKNLYNGNPGFIINAQYKEYSIVFPEPGMLHDQIMVVLWSLNPRKPYTVEYLSFSNVPELKGKTVLTDDEVIELSQQAMAVKRRFYYDLEHNCDCVFDDFGVDIEFKIDSTTEPRKIYIKQARLFK